MNRPLLLSALLAVALLYTLWSARPLWSDLALLAVLAVAVRSTWAGWEHAAPPELRWPALALLAAYGLAALFSVEPLRSWRAVLGLVGYGLAWMLAGNLLARGVAREDVYRALLMAGQVIVAALAANWLGHGAPLVWRFRIETNNALFFFNLLLFPALASGVWRRLVAGEWVYVAWFSASRGGLLGMLAALLALRGPARRWRLGGLALCGVLALSIGARFAEKPGNVLNGQGRDQAWAVALAMWSESPWVGQGPDTYKGFWMAGGPRVYAIGHAHNLYLNLAAETGVVGLAAGAWLAAALLRRLWRRAASEAWAGAALAGSVALLAQSVFDVPTTAPYITLAWLALVRVGLANPATTGDVVERIAVRDGEGLPAAAIATFGGGGHPVVPPPVSTMRAAAIAANGVVITHRPSSPELAGLDDDRASPQTSVLRHQQK